MNPHAAACLTRPTAYFPLASLLGLFHFPQGIPPMREGGKRRIVVPPGPLQQQGTKSLVWMVGLLGALEEAGGEYACCPGFD